MRSLVFDRFLDTAQILGASTLALLLLLAAGPAGATADSIRGIDVDSDESGTVISIWADGDIEDMSYRRLEDPGRLVIDFPGLGGDLSSDRIAVDSGQVARVRVGFHPDKLRVVVDVSDPSALATARVLRGQQGIGVIFGSAQAPSLSNSPHRRPIASTAKVEPTRPRRASQETPDAMRDELAAATRELAAAAEELRAAARELRAARGLETAAPAPRSETRTAPKSMAAEQRAAAGETPEARMAAAPPPQRPPEPTRDSAPSVPTAPTPSASPPAVADYAGFLSWLEQHADTQPTFRAGDIIRQAELAKLEPFFAPGYYEEFDFPTVEVEIAETENFVPHEIFRQATLQYGGQTTLGEDSSLQNYVAGRPFPPERIEAAPPERAAYMVAWNLVRRWQHTGYRSRGVQMAYMSLGPRGGRTPAVDAVLTGDGVVERHLSQFYQRVYLNHLATHADDDYAIDVSDAKTHYFKEFMEFTDPFEMRGSMFVIERSLDPYERDQVNSYLPTERRIRRLSPKERADRFAGSEFTLDDFEAFSGRVLDYDWRLLGEKSVLQVSNARNRPLRMFGPGSRVPHDRWQLRDTWVVELRPHLEGHPYSRKILFVDKQTFNSATAVIFDRDDRLLKIMNIVYFWPGEIPQRPGAPPAQTVTLWNGSTAINKQTDVSTITWADETEIPEVTASSVRRLFSVSNLTGGR